MNIINYQLRAKKNLKIGIIDKENFIKNEIEKVV